MSYDSWLEPPENFAPEPVYGTCFDCDGSKLMENADYDDEYQCDCKDCDCIEKKKQVDCWHCSGTGEVEQEECDSCNGLPCYCDAAYEAWAGK